MVTVPEMSKGKRLSTVSSTFEVGMAEFFRRWCYVLSSQLHAAMTEESTHSNVLTMRNA